MRYILRNIRLFMTNQRGIYLLSIAAVMSSVFLLHFSYSLYQSFMKEKDAQSVEADWLGVELQDLYTQKGDPEDNSDYRIIPRKGTKYVTIKDLKRLLKNLSEEFQKEVQTIGADVVVEGVPYVCCFGVENGEIVMSKQYRDNVTGNLLEEGRFFTEEEYKEGLRVALDEAALSPKQKLLSPYLESIRSKDRKYLTIAGKKYRIIGKHSFYPDLPIIPITSLPEDYTLDGCIEFYFEGAVNSLQYTELKDVVEETLGNHASIPDMDLPDMDKIYLYNTMIIIAVLIAVVSALNFVILYQYFLEKRQEEIRAMRICGMKRRRAVVMFLAECVCLTLPVYVLSVFLYDRFALRMMSSFYTYVDDHYSLKLYLELFAIYYISSLIILLVSIWRRLQGEGRMRIGGGRV